MLVYFLKSKFNFSASDEMAIKMCGEMKGGSDWDYKKIIYNNAFSGGDINFSRNVKSSKKVVFQI